MQEYSAGQIQILEGLSAVRKTPGMYIGSTSSSGLHHLVYELVDNAVDEALAGFCDEITVTVYKDESVSVRDNGRGIPVDIHPQRGIPAVEVVFTILHAGGKFGSEGGYKVSGGLHGVGGSVVNALSKWLKVKIYRNGEIHEQEYHEGEVATPLTVTGKTEETGSFIHFKPDETIFEETHFSHDGIKKHLQETAFLTKGIKINFIDLREEEPKEVSFLYEGGIKEYVEYINRNKTPLDSDVFYAEAIRDGILVEIAIQYTDDFHESVYTYVNNINTVDGGTHLSGFRAGITKTINSYGREYGFIKENEENLTGDDAREGITAVLSLKIENPQFESQTKGKLGNSEARGAVETVINEYFEYYLEENPDIGKKIIDKVLSAQRARVAARKARDLVRRKTGLDSARMPGKLVDCDATDPAKCEIFIVEGDSAGGSAKEARDPNIQAILPLRGKILNVEKARLERILDNEEIKAMITAFGTGIKEDFDISKLRYHKIVLMTDADVDGAHIRTLLLTFLYRFMRPLIEEGYVYIAQPPLFKVEKGRDEHYVYGDDKNLDLLLEEIGRDGIRAIQRYKGLGEMDPVQLWDTTMDPEKRTLLQVTVEDSVLADDIFTQLMGEKVESRREFINEHASLVKNLDI